MTQVLRYAVLDANGVKLNGILVNDPSPAPAPEPTPDEV